MTPTNSSGLNNGNPFGLPLMESPYRPMKTPHPPSCSEGVLVISLLLILLLANHIKIVKVGFGNFTSPTLSHYLSVYMFLCFRMQYKTHSPLATFHRADRRVLSLLSIRVCPKYVLLYYPLLRRVCLHPLQGIRHDGWHLQSYRYSI